MLQLPSFVVILAVALGTALLVPEKGLSVVGKMCVRHEECGHNATCLGANDSQEAGTFSGGYCTFFDCHRSECPSGSECILVEESGSYLCLLTCQREDDCRGGYRCQSGACLPA